MTSSFRRFAVVFAAALICATSFAAQGRADEARTPALAQAAPADATASVSPGLVAAPEQLASVDEIKNLALKSILAGEFRQTNDLLTQAAARTNDPVVAQMAGWMGQFEKQRGAFASERHEQYEKAVGDVRKLIDHGKESYALDATARAYLLADDKAGFRKEPWVDELVTNTTKLADEAEAQEKWLTALRLYSDLGSIEPANPLWKDRLKLATRRIRLVAIYTPDQFKEIQEAELKDREEADALIRPATQPTTTPSETGAFIKSSTQPTTQEEAADVIDAAEDSFRVDWKETLRGIDADMLVEAIKDTKKNYYKPIDYRTLMKGGMSGIKAVLTTRGLEEADGFGGLADAAQRDAFVAFIDKQIARFEASDDESEKALVEPAISQLRSTNRNTVNIPENVLISEFADGAFGELDPFSSMIWPSDVEEFNKSTQGEFSGVGIQIQSGEDGSLNVVSPLEDSPAYKKGIKAGDVITKINGKNAKGISLNQAVKSITGPAGTSVTLEIRSPDAKSVEYVIERQTIKVASVKGWLHRPGGGWDYFVDPVQKIGYLRMTNFTRTTSKELDQACQDLIHNGAKAMILDLRYNPGGLLQAATEVSDRFVSKGTIVSTKADRDNTPHKPWSADANEDKEFSLPTVVLVNQYSASASEIVAGALKDLDRALIVGERTFGKGSVQMLLPLEKRTAYLKLTTSHYYLPGGKCIHREENSQEWGVDPNLTIEMTPEQMRVAIDARQELDVLRDVNSAPAEGEQRKLNDIAPSVEETVATATPAKKDPLGSDPQLSAALLLLRMQLAGASL